MSVVLVVAAVALLSVPGGASALGRRLPPAEWARLVALAARVGFTSLLTGLFFLGAPTVFGVFGLEEAAGACHSLVSGAPLAGSPAGWAAVAVFGFVVAAATRAHRRSGLARRTLRIESWLGSHEAHDGFDVVALPSKDLIAYAAPGSPPQVVVSDATIALLRPDEFAALVRHELSHLRHRHERLLRLAAVIEGAIGIVPVLRRTPAALRAAVERWADEDAAAAPGERAAVRGALHKCAYAATTARRSRGVDDRVLALSRTRSCGNWLLRLAVGAPAAIAVSAVAMVGVFWLSSQHHGVLALVGYCPV